MPVSYVPCSVQTDPQHDFDEGNWFPWIKTLIKGLFTSFMVLWIHICSHSTRNSFYFKFIIRTVSLEPTQVSMFARMLQYKSSCLIRREPRYPTYNKKTTLVSFLMLSISKPEIPPRSTSTFSIFFHYNPSFCACF